MNRSLCRLPSILVLSGLLLAWAGCTDEDITNIQPESDDLYTVTGRVLSYPSLQPVAGATYSLLAGPRTGASDATGRFEIADVEQGAHLITFAAEGHAPGQATVRLGDTGYAKNSGAHWDLHIVETSSSLDVQVYGAPGGLPVAGAGVSVVDVRLPSAIASRVDLSAFSASAVTDGEGLAHLTGLPAATVTVVITAGDANGDGVADFASQTREVALRPDFASSIDVVLLTGAAAATVLETNIPSYSGDDISAPTLWLLFSAPMDTSPEATRVIVARTNSPYAEIPVSAIWTSPLRLEISSPGSPIAFSVSVSLSLRTVRGATLNWSRYVSWSNDTDPLPGDCGGLVTDLRLALGHQPLDMDTRAVNLAWSAVAGSGGYDIYARDDLDNQDWVWLATEPADFDTGNISASVVLPTIFDRFAADGIQTPLAGTTVTLCVVPRRAVDAAPGAPHGMLVLADTTPPSLVRTYQSGAGTNVLSFPQVFTLVVDFSEYVAQGVAAPALSIVEGGGDPAFVLDSAAAVWSWENGRHGGAFSFLLEPGQDASGDRMQVSFTALTDLAGNLLPGTATSAEITIAPWSNQFDFENSSQGWADTGPGWDWGRPSRGPESGHNDGNCWGTTLAVPYGTNWDTSVVSPPVMIRPGATRLRFWRWADLYYDDVITVQLVLDDASTVQLATYTYSYNNIWVAENFDLSGYVDRFVRVRFRFQTDSYASNDRDGFFVDDVGIGVE